MKTCPKCNNLADNNAVSCERCGMVLDQSVISRAARPRVPTVTEASAPSMSALSPNSDFRPVPPPSAGSMTGASFTSAASTAASPARPANSRRGHTVYMPPPAVNTGASPAVGPIPAARRILAVLVTYSWKLEGQVFPVREGRNLIGRSEECDVHVPEDAALSGTNTHITYRQNFTVGDLVSMGGTDLDGVPIEEQFRPLRNLAQIRAGSTNFVFIIVDPQLLDLAN